MPKRLTSFVEQAWERFRPMAAFWTSVFVMVIPIGLAVLIAWPEAKLFAFGIMLLGAILGAVGLGFTVSDRRKATEKEKEERDWRNQQRLNDQQEHDELLALLAGSKSKMTTPRVIRLIERIREGRAQNERGDDGGM